MAAWQIYESAVYGVFQSEREPSPRQLNDSMKHRLAHFKRTTSLTTCVPNMFYPKDHWLRWIISRPIQILFS